MSNWDEIGFAPQGWQCPVCGAVYSPMTMQCFNCTGWKISNNTDTNTKTIDWLHHDSVTKTGEQKESR